MAEGPPNFETWIAIPADGGEAVQAVLDIARWVIPHEELGGVKEDEFKLYGMVAAPYQSYSEKESAKEFYLDCCRHVGQLYAALKAHPKEMAPFAECIMGLAHSMHQLDSKTGKEALTILPSMSAARRLEIAKVLDTDRQVFSRLLADGVLALRKYPPACLMFTEFGRILFRFNAYQPPARTVHDAHKILLDSKGEINYYDELLESALQFIESESPVVELLQEEPAASPQEGPNKNATAVFECASCGKEYEVRLNTTTMMDGCPHCAGASKAEEID